MDAGSVLLEFVSKRFPGSEMHRVVAGLVATGLSAADPVQSVASSLSLEDTCVYLRGERVWCGDGIYVLGFGKASRGMARGVLASTGARGGVVIAPKGQGGRVDGIRVLEGNHPVPGEDTLSSSKALVDYASRLPRDSLAVVLVSGGGSALFEIPAPGVGLGDIAFVTRELLKRGADIWELNAVRKHLSRVKGGQFLRYIGSGRVLGLVISDVIGDRLDTIASGPTVPDETSFEDAKAVLEKYGLWETVPSSVREWISRGVRGEAPETPKPGDPLFEKVTNTIVASNRVSLEAMEEKCRSLGHRCLVLGSRVRGEAREVARALAGIVEAIAYESWPVEPPAILLAGGETTVTVRGRGVGGRNQELCLSLALELHRYRFTAPYAAICMGSDGVDGVSPAAGAVVDGEAVPEALARGLDPAEFLSDNDSYSFFKALGRAIHTGYTGTNVNDFIAVYVGRP